MPLAEKIQFKGLHACQTWRGCPKTNEMPKGCPVWRDEIWEDENLQPQRIQGCGYMVDAYARKWVAGRAALAATTAQKMREENQEVVGRFRFAIDDFFIRLQQVFAPIEDDVKKELPHDGNST